MVDTTGSSNTWVGANQSYVASTSSSVDTGKSVVGFHRRVVKSEPDPCVVPSLCTMVPDGSLKKNGLIPSHGSQASRGTR
ncbi:hypothetical protein L210DRAFT_3563364 [Boletus edulis BED1]|uniref:Uncharacterized protein n=1 Tax=Boletus edulis BED1 TaxID=1328754 RepID=A0AAD4G8C2_BOLED|nr:hypothetical protein L210DRAFT_3563364 [Boletus edulis BED1]